MPGTILHQLLTERGRRRTFQITNATWLNNASRPRRAKLGKLSDFMTALRKQDSAAKLVIASQNAFDAVLESYKQGLSTYPEIVSAERNLASARSVGHDTQSAIFTTAIALALSTGDLARPSARPLRPSAVRSFER